MRSRPPTGRCSASARIAGAIGAAGWIAGLGMGVVEVEHVGADAVDQRGVERVHPLGAAEQGGAGATP